ncbi:carbonic anhydrase [marine gamma proteobacterium HTCC2143]|jgi:carbonic anhydrase|uniref:carbonic anhydrase n=1 Tax=marine gamma proteobacterium HTCC2143 TaxID=247633 RepID=A0Y8N9_9GAMM|nr:carbonic anhydrase [marine gamma proteobacterium HTCC2143]
MSDIDALVAGFKEFHEVYTEDREGKYHGLAEYGPHSKILMIACCDSRVDPAIITNSSAGDLMVIRNMANLVPPYDAASTSYETPAAIEFAACYLQVEHIVVMGHSRCAGIRSLLTRLVDDSDPTRPLDKWTVVAEPAAKQVLIEMPDADLDDQSCACSRKALAASLNNLRTYPWIAERLSNKSIAIHGWYFNLATGELERYQEDSETFEQLF